MLQMLDSLLATLIREMQNDRVEGRRAEAKKVARRFIRSVARIFVVVSAEMSPQTNKKRQLVYDILIYGIYFLTYHYFFYSLIIVG